MTPVAVYNVRSSSGTREEVGIIPCCPVGHAGAYVSPAQKRHRREKGRWKMNQQTSEKKKVSVLRVGLDIGKLIASLLVLAIHVIPSPLPETSYQMGGYLLIEILARSAVPFFFVTSSFLFYKANRLYDCQTVASNVSKYIIRIFQIYLFWFVINLPITLYFRIYIFRDNLVWAVLNQIKAFFLTSTFPSSWFLVACVFSILLVQILSKRFSAFAILVLLFPMELLCIVSTQYGQSLTQNSVWQAFIKVFAEPHVSILAGPFYFAVGKYLAEKDDTKRLEKNMLTGIAILSYFGMVGEYALSRIENWYYTLNRCFFLIPFVVAVFLLAERYEPKFEVNYKFCSTIRKYSVFLFCTQWIYISLLNVLERVNLAFPPQTNYIIIVFLSIACYRVYDRIANIDSLRWLQKML